MKKTTITTKEFMTETGLQIAIKSIDRYLRHETLTIYLRASRNTFDKIVCESLKEFKKLTEN